MLLLPLLLSLAPQAPTVGLGGLGKIDFPNSGAPAAQADFLRGALLLHSFEYDDSAEAFRAAEAADPGFALAFWGEAMTHAHPIWQEEDVGAAREALARLAPTPAARAEKAPTERERGLLAAAEILFGEGERAPRWKAYAHAMGELHGRFPQDDELAAFHAVALLGSATNGRDIPTYMRAAAIAEEILVRNPDHPGALHYAIHSYDDPVHAPLGLRMARHYGVVAAAAEHALHMPSHIYVALGLWRDSVASNVASIAAGDARRARKGLGLDGRAYHSLYWLCYSELQLGHVAEARRRLEEMRRDVAAGPSKRTRTHLVLMRAAYVTATDDWAGELARFEVDLAGLERAPTAAEAFVRAYGALRRGEAPGAAGDTLAALVRERDPKKPAAPAPADCCSPAAQAAYSPSERALSVMEAELRAVLGADAAVVRRELEAAAAAEDAMGFDFGPPTVVKPAHELLGEWLLAAGEPAAARTHFEAALRRAPGRARAWLGLARAARAAGDAELARATYADLAQQWSEADADLAALAEVRAGAR